MTIGVVTVTYNSGRVIYPFLASLLNQTHSDFAAYIIDNASSDDTCQQVAQFNDARLQLIGNSDNLGIAEANNQGIRRALNDGCESILLINNDTEFGPSLLKELLRGLDEYSCDMVAPKILCYHDRTIWSAGGGIDPRRAGSGFHYGYGQVDHGQFDTPRLVDHAPACCLLLRKEVFGRIGVMDSRYFTYIEDTDFCYRARQAGLKLMYLPSATVLHKAHSLTGGLASDFMMRYTTRNRVYFMLKHFGPWRGLIYIVAYQMYLLLQLISPKASMSRFWLREKAFFEGLNLYRNSAHG